MSNVQDLNMSGVILNLNYATWLVITRLDADPGYT